jgi:hypothetical protein
VKVPLWVILAIGGILLGVAALTRSMPYGLIPFLVVGWLASQHASSPAASERSKRVVVLVTVWATALASTLPVGVIPGVVILVGVGAYILLHRDVTTPGP